MRVIHDHQKWLALIHALEPPGNALQILDSFLDDFVGKAERLPRANGGEQVVHIDPAHEPRSHFQSSVWRLRGEMQALEA